MKRILCVVMALLLLLLPPLAVAAAAFCLPSQYSDTFYGELNEKTDMLYAAEGRKCIVVGGSSVAFGIDSALLEKYLGMQTVNFGLYAALGTKLMLELSLDAVGEGDIVILSPELDAQTLSLYFNAEATWKALDDDMSLLRYLDADDRLALLGALWGFASEKWQYARTSAPNPEGVYNAKNFDENGDLKYTRLQNTMPLYYDPNQLITLQNGIIDSDFLTYLNGYIDDCKSRGAEVWFAFCPLNEAGLSPDEDASTRAAFQTYLKANLHCDVVGDIEDAVLNAGYFYDTNFHLNEAGRRTHTVRLCKSLLAARWDATAVTEEEFPAATLIPLDPNFDGYDENEIYFTYAENANGTLTVTGLTEAGKSQAELTVPLGAQGKKVLIFGENVLADGNCRSLTVPAETNLRIFLNGAFTGSNLEVMYLYVSSPDTVYPPNSFTGVASGFSVHVPTASSYATHYYWSERGLIFHSDL